MREEIENLRERKHGARSAKQAIAIGLSKARRAGVDLPPPEKGSTSERTRRRARRRPIAPGGSRPCGSRTRSRAATRALKREAVLSSPRRHLRSRRVQPCRIKLHPHDPPPPTSRPDKGRSGKLRDGEQGRANACAQRQVAFSALRARLRDGDGQVAARPVGRGSPDRGVYPSSARAPLPAEGLGDSASTVPRFPRADQPTFQSPATSAATRGRATYAVSVRRRELRILPIAGRSEASAKTLIDFLSPPAAANVQSTQRSARATWAFAAARSRALICISSMRSTISL